MKTVIFLIFVLALTSCGKRSDLYFEDKSVRLPQEGAISFNDLKSNIFETKCMGCHKGFKEEKNIYKFINEENPEESRLFLSVKEGSMPKGKPPLNSQELEMVRLYVHNMVREVSFEEINTAIIAPKCLSCHKRAVDEASIQKWINAESPLESKLLTTTVSGSMPKNAPHLTRKEINMIKGYLLKKPVVVVQGVTFEEINTAIIAPKCLNCHKRAVDEVGIQKWINAESPLESKLLTTTESGFMPKNAPHLTPEEIGMIKSYLLKKPVP